MPDESTQSITISAEPAEVMAVIADFAAYPEWADGVRSCEVLDRHDDGSARQVRFQLDAGVLKDDYTLEYAWAPDGTRVDWHLVKGQLQRAQRGAYDLQAVAAGTQVVYTLAVDLAVPMLGVLKRKAEKVIMDTALKGLKKRVEQG
jgi:ribosome-associated toxin RatA of RatAB toxin-antitoxin module